MALSALAVLLAFFPPLLEPSSPSYPHSESSYCLLMVVVNGDE